MEKRPKRPKKYNPENVWLWKNQVRFKFLIAIAAFQDDVRKMRKKLDLPPDGRPFKTFDEGSLERMANIDSWEGKTVEEIREEVAKLPRPPALDRDLLRQCARELVDQYDLPDNFCHTLERYIHLNFEGAPPNSWEIETSHDWDNRDMLPRSISLKIFAPLREDEMEAAVKELKKEQRKSFPKGSISLKARQEFMRNVKVFEMWQEMNGEDVDEESRMTSKEIGDEFKLSGGAVRQIVKEMKKLAKDMFGIKIV